MSPKTADPFAAILRQADRMAKATKAAAAVAEPPATVEVPSEAPDRRPMETWRSPRARRVFSGCDLCGEELCSGCVLPEGATYPCARCGVNETALPNTWCLPCVRRERETKAGAPKGTDR